MKTYQKDAALTLLLCFELRKDLMSRALRNFIHCGKTLRSITDLDSFVYNL